MCDPYIGFDYNRIGFGKWAGIVVVGDVFGFSGRYDGRARTTRRKPVLAA